MPPYPLDRLGGEPHTRLRYFCSPHQQDSALYPSIVQLERAAGFGREDTDAQRLDKLEAVLALGTNDLSEAAPLLADLLSIPTGDRYGPPQCSASVLSPHGFHRACASPLTSEHWFLQFRAKACIRLTPLSITHNFTHFEQRDV
jgi:predicted ATPase